MNYFENEFQRLVFREDISLLSQYWTAKTKHLSNEGYMLEESIFTDTVRLLNPVNMLVNFENFDVTINPDLQIWLVKENFSVYQSCGMKRGALVASKHLFPQISVLQTIEEHKFAGIDWRVFEAESDAVQWLQTAMNV
jgi:hypothetical protein